MIKEFGSWKYIAGAETARSGMATANWAVSLVSGLFHLEPGASLCSVHFLLLTTSNFFFCKVADEKKVPQKCPYVCLCVCHT